MSPTETTIELIELGLIEDKDPEELREVTCGSKKNVAELPPDECSQKDTFGKNRERFCRDIHCPLKDCPHSW